jgi:hypothetical protein
MDSPSNLSISLSLHPDSRAFLFFQPSLVFFTTPGEQQDKHIENATVTSIIGMVQNLQHLKILDRPGHHGSSIINDKVRWDGQAHSSKSFSITFAPDSLKVI